MIQIDKWAHMYYCIKRMVQEKRKQQIKEKELCWKFRT